MQVVVLIYGCFKKKGP